LSNSEMNVTQPRKKTLFYCIAVIILTTVAVFTTWYLKFKGIITKEEIENVFNPLQYIPRIPVGENVENFIDWLLENIRFITRAVSDFLKDIMDGFADFLLEFPPCSEVVLPFFVIILISLLAWYFSDKNVALFTFIGLALINNMELWEPAIETLTMILISVLISVCIGLPVGILTARSNTIHRVVWPILDFMQTMPAFVYLIPAVFFFGLGVVSAMVATIVFSMPPVIRLTGLGIRQVSHEVVEAATSFGSTHWQKLIKVQLPLAKPTIMAGINQCIMLALSMVVIAAMIGGGGLGSEVLRGITRLDIDLGFEGGLAVVIVAIILDRITQSTSQQKAGEE